MSSTSKARFCEVMGVLAGPLSARSAFAAPVACQNPEPVPGVVEVGQGMQQALHYPQVIQWLAVGVPFRSSSVDREDRELLLSVTPHPVQPLAPATDLPEPSGECLRRHDPNFFELYFFENGDFDHRAGLLK